MSSQSVCEDAGCRWDAACSQKGLAWKCLPTYRNSDTVSDEDKIQCQADISASDSKTVTTYFNPDGSCYTGDYEPASDFGCFDLKNNGEYCDVNGSIKYVGCNSDYTHCCFHETNTDVCAEKITSLNHSIVQNVSQASQMKTSNHHT
eukprot:UN32988